jgi:hypothetical protein
MRSLTPRAHWIGAGETRGGARVHALMRLDREIRIGGAEGEEVLPLLCFRNGHDGGLAVTVSVAPFRLVCLNGMLIPLPDAQRTWKARHTARIEARLADARRTLGIAWRYYDELEEVGARLLAQRMGEGEFERFLARLVPLPEPRPDETNGGRAVRNAERVREAIRTAYRTTPDLTDIYGMGRPRPAPTSTTRSQLAAPRIARPPRRASSAPPSQRRSRIARSNYSPKEASSDRHPDHGPARADQAE